MSTNCLLTQALHTASKTDKFEDYILIEEVQQSWETKEFDKGGPTQRILSMEENVMLAQNRWRGNGRFLMRKANNVGYLPVRWLQWRGPLLQNDI